MALKNKLRFKVSDIAPSHIGQIMQPKNLARLQIDNAELVIEALIDDRPIVYLSLHKEHFPLNESFSYHVAKTSLYALPQDFYHLIDTINYARTLHSTAKLVSRHSLEELQTLLILIDLGCHTTMRDAEERITVVEVPDSGLLIRRPRSGHQDSPLSSHGEALLRDWLQIDSNTATGVDELISLITKAKNLVTKKTADKSQPLINWVMSQENAELLFLNRLTNRQSYIQLTKTLNRNKIRTIFDITEDPYIEALSSLFGFIDTATSGSIRIYKRLNT